MIWKVEVVACFTVLSQYSPGHLGKPKNIVCRIAGNTPRFVLNIFDIFLRLRALFIHNIDWFAGNP
jgi:hypothetical protein